MPITPADSRKTRTSMRSMIRMMLMAVTTALVALLLPAMAHANDTSPIYRLYNPWTGEHLFTVSAQEYQTLPASGWVAEGVGWESPSASEVPVYRLYN